ncbi:MAG: hypothetical protein HYT79_03455 [Elusimicrobia bacterium]|nr:hypothetical protein [Elusimicrobiota bacterium]
MKKAVIAMFLIPMLTGGLLGADTKSKDKASSSSAADAEKQKALASPYANDLGPDKIEEVVKGYPKNIQEGYRLTLAKCAACHTTARPLHSQFVEPEGKDEAEKKKLAADWAAKYADKNVWQIEDSIWKRYVKRMSAKPGCNVGQDGKKIWEFLVYDSSRRKVGANAESWKAHRLKLLKEFKEKYPARYKELYGDH